MENSQNTNIYDFLDKEISELLSVVVQHPNRRMRIVDVIQILLKIEILIPQIVIDGDEMVKYFNKKSR